jgi:hypothetical protein
MGIKHIVCYSGGHSSALVAIEVVRRFGKENVILVNHQLILEDADVARFENQVAKYLEMEITYVNFDGWETKDQFDVVIERGSFVNTRTRQALCTSVMKTMPFNDWLTDNFKGDDCVIYYGFDKSEPKRITRRSPIMAAMGYKTDYPLALWDNRTIFETTEIGIQRPNLYSMFKHANCIGCLKAGHLHWYAVYCNYPEIYAKAIATEEEIGYSIVKDSFLKDMIDKFEKMKDLGIKPTEHVNGKKFWNDARKKLAGVCEFDFKIDVKPCECFE